MSDAQKPWPRQKLDLHVTQRIRERVDIALILYRDDDGHLEARLRERGEQSVWRVVLDAIDEAGWQVCQMREVTHAGA